ncbi:MAG TPA: hypothetical protein VF956_08135 [Candidatus Dormibacteraeota bacterium]
MRVAGLALLLVVAACSAQSGENASPSPQPASPTPAAPACRLPVAWDDGSTSHRAFVTYPGGHIDEVGQTNGDVYDAQYQRWVQGPRELISPDGSRYTYWSYLNNPIGAIHVVDVVSGADRIVYNGATNYWPIAFASEGIYVLHAINIKQNAFEGLFRLDPAAGTVVKVPGSDLLPQARWTLVSGGSAWGFDFQPGTQPIVYRVKQLNLATGTITDWLQEPPNVQLPPIGLDAQGRVYLSDSYQLWRLDAPNVEEHVLTPPPVSGRVSLNIFVADAQGEWMGGWGGLWHYSDAGGAQRFSVGTDQDMVTPAGPCL